MATLVFGSVLSAVGIGISLYTMWLIATGRPIAIGFMIPHLIRPKGRIVVFLFALILLVLFVMSLLSLWLPLA